MRGTTRRIHTPLRNRFFSKVIFVMAFILALSLFAFGLISSAVLSRTLIEKEIDYQWQAINSMARYLSDMELRFATVLYSVDDKRYMDIMQYLRTDQEDYGERERVLSHLSAMLGANEDILDVILIRESDGRALSRTKSRWILTDAIADSDGLEQIKQGGDGLTILKTHSPEYVRNSDEPVLTYAINLSYGYNAFVKQYVGTLIVNYRVKNLYRAVDAFSHLEGNLMVLDRDGYVIYDVAGLFTGHDLPYYDRLEPGEGRIELQRRSQLTLMDKATLNNYYIACVTPMDAVLKDAVSIRALFTSLNVALVAAAVLLMVASGRLLSKKVRRVSEAMEAFESGDFAHRISVQGDDEIDGLAKGFNQMSERLAKYIDQVYGLEARHKSAELSALQSQINPHFLFNVLETIRMEAVDRDQEGIAQMVFTLGKIFRHNLRNKAKIVTVRTEVEYLGYYLQLQKYRLGDRLDYSIEIDPALLHCGIPKFSLQPLVENAIDHGIAERERGGFVEITGELRGQDAVFYIVDDGVGLEESRLFKIRAGLKNPSGQTTERIGLFNVNDRIRLLFSGGYGIEIDCKQGKTIVKMTIPRTEGDQIV